MSYAPSRWKHKLSIAQRISSKLTFKLLGHLNRNIQPVSSFNIKKGYHHARIAETFNDTIYTNEWQNEIYTLAVSLAAKLSNPSIIDVGCGSAYKLLNLLGRYDITGIELKNTHEWLVKTYPARKWLVYDETDPQQLHADIVLCSDVIEHIDNPDELMNFLQKISFHQLILSTPERDEIAGKNDYGPPENTAHYREWNKDEFKTYVSRWFDIKEQHIFYDKSITQVVICQKIKA